MVLYFQLVFVENPPRLFQLILNAHSISPTIFRKKAATGKLRQKWLDTVIQDLCSDKSGIHISVTGDILLCIEQNKNIKIVNVWTLFSRIYREFIPTRTVSIFTEIDYYDIIVRFDVDIFLTIFPDIFAIFYPF